LGTARSQNLKKQCRLFLLREAIIKGLGVEEVASFRYKWTKTNKVHRAALL
jgi:hypothetical protein